MAQKWYEKATVQAALVGGVFVIIAALITTFLGSKELTKLKEVRIEYKEDSVSEYKRLESKQKALLLSLETQIDAYARLLEYAELTEEERKACEEEYEKLKAELEKQKFLIEVLKKERSNAETELQKLKNDAENSSLNFLTLFEDRNRYENLYKKTKIELNRYKKLYTEAEAELKRLKYLWEQVQKRSQPIALRDKWIFELKDDEVKKMLVKLDFYDAELNPNGKGLENNFELQFVGNDAIVIDHSTGLTWQRSGSDKVLLISPNLPPLNHIFNNQQLIEMYGDTTVSSMPEYLNTLNHQKFGGYNNWRLPTLEEAMSLMEAQPQYGMHIDRIFDPKQTPIWTFDQSYYGAPWLVYYDKGNCEWYSLSVLFWASFHVRAVRSEE